MNRALNVIALLAPVVVTLTLMECPSIVVADDRGLEQRFRSEYPSASVKLQAAAAHVTCDGYLVTNNNIKRNNTYYIDDSSRLVISRYTELSGQPTEREAVQCRTSDYFFQLSRPSPDKPFVVNSASRGQGIPKNTDSLTDLGINRYVEAAFSIGGIPVKQMLDHPSFRILAIETASNGSDEEADVEFKCDDPAHWVGAGKMTFTPSLDWALSGYVVDVVAGRRGTGMPRGSTYKGTVRCRRWEGGHVFPEEGRFEFFYPGEGRRSVRVQTF